MFQEGQQIGIYKLISPLGRGGFGEVWLAEKTSEGFRTFSKKVAVKLPHREMVDVKAFEQEALLWEEASGHPNVLPIIDADIYDGQIVIVSEYADGGSLDDKLEKEGKFPINKAVETTVGILNGLEYLHHKKIIHRDIKPQNILLQGGTPRLADFGISRAMQTTKVSSNIVGTDAYMSPEALDGKRSVQTDVWSVGVVLYELLKNDLPFPQEHPSERMFAILMKEFEPLSFEIPYKLRDVVKKALAKKPAERYFSAIEMKQDLLVLLSELNHQSYAETKPVFENENISTKPIVITGEPIIFTGEQKNISTAPQPRRLKEIEELDNEVQKTEASVTQVSRQTGENRANSQQFFKPLMPDNFQSADITRQKTKPKSSFFIIGAASLGILILFGTIFGGYFIFFVGKSEQTSSTASNNELKNTVLIGDRIRIAKDLRGYVSSSNKMTVAIQITGIGEADVIEEIRNDNNLQVEINGQSCTLEESQVVNGSILKILATSILSPETMQNFKADKIQDFVMNVDIIYKNDVVSKNVETKFQKSKAQNDKPSLGNAIDFEDVIEKNVEPTKVKPIAKQNSIQKQNPQQRNNYPQRQTKTVETEKKQIDGSKKGTTVDDDYSDPVEKINKKADRDIKKKTGETYKKPIE